MIYECEYQATGSMYMEGRKAFDVDSRPSMFDAPTCEIGSLAEEIAEVAEMLRHLKVEIEMLDNEARRRSDAVLSAQLAELGFTEAEILQLQGAQ